MPAQFEIFKDNANPSQFRFRLKAPNNEIIAVSEAYTTKVACMEGIESVRKNATGAVLQDLT